MSEQPAGLSRLGPICCVTITAPDLDAVERAYVDYLHFRVVARGKISAPIARLWSRPGAAGRRFLSLAPAGGDDFTLRFVAADREPDFAPFSTYGWNAAEIIVQDVDALAGQLAHSPFQIIGAPQNLSFSDDIRAMQVLGPGHELLYLTEFKKPVPGLDTPIARCPVDKVFIMILAGPSIDALQDFFATQFSVPRAPIIESRVKGMSAAFGNSPEHKYPIAALPLLGQSFIEVDQMPEQAAHRNAPDGELPGGIAIVSFNGTCAVRQREVIDQPEPPYTGAGSVSCLTGTAGELIEVITPTDA
jgi:hypothetical protein